MNNVGHQRSALSPSDFRDVFRAELPYVYRTLRRLGVHPSDLEDLCQEVFVAVYRHYNEYDPTRPIRPWIVSFAVRVAANYRRLARHKHETAMEDRDWAAAGPNPEQGAAHAEARKIILKALEELDFDRRTVIVLHDLDGMKAKEIATIVSAKPNTVYSRLRLARRDFQEAVLRLQGSEISEGRESS